MVSDDVQIERLRKYNALAGIAHLAQAIVVLLLANNFSLGVQAAYMAGPPGDSAPRQIVQLFSIRIAFLVALFFLLSAAAHFYVAGPGWNRYTANLKRQRNPFRWIEYSISASVMIVLIALITGINDVAALVALVGVNASMIGFGWLQERYEQPGGGWLPFVLGCGAGIAPWIAIGIYLIAPGAHSHAPGFVYGIFISLFVLFNLFAVTQWLQYAKVGKWSNYLAGERTYITLSLTAKSALAWQIFAATLAASTVH